MKNFFFLDLRYSIKSYLTIRAPPKVTFLRVDEGYSDVIKKNIVEVYMLVVRAYMPGVPTTVATPAYLDNNDLKIRRLI